VFESYEGLSKRTSDFIVDYVNQHPAATLCLAGGDTPRKTYDYLVEAYEQKKVSFSACTFVALDEFVGIGREEEGSCYRFLHHALLDHIDIQTENCFFFDAMASDLAQECQRMDDIIQQRGGIDVVLLGVGMNGHLGFNEPLVPFHLHAHVVELDHTSQTVGQKYFQEERVLEKGITLGIQHVLDAKKAILIANGQKKASIMCQTIEDDITIQVPATALKMHTEAYVFIDKEAASKLTKR